MFSRFVRAGTMAVSVLLLSVAAFGQVPADAKSDATTLPVSTTSSAAFAELLLKKTELQSEVEALMLDYTDEYPRLKEIRFVLTLIDRESSRLGKVKAADASRLTLALGKLISRKIDLETELWQKQASYKDEHPEVRRAKKRIEIFENAIAQILK